MGDVNHGCHVSFMMKSKRWNSWLPISVFQRVADVRRRLCLKIFNDETLFNKSLVVFVRFSVAQSSEQRLLCLWSWYLVAHACQRISQRSAESRRVSPGAPIFSRRES